MRINFDGLNSLEAMKNGCTNEVVLDMKNKLITSEDPGISISKT